MNNNIAKLIELNQKGLLTDEELAKAIKSLQVNSKEREKNILKEIDRLTSEFTYLNLQNERAEKENDTATIKLLERRSKEVNAEISKLENELNKVKNETANKERRERTAEKMYKWHDIMYLRSLKNNNGERVYSDEYISSLSEQEKSELVFELKRDIDKAKEKHNEENTSAEDRNLSSSIETTDTSEVVNVDDNQNSELSEEKTVLDTIKNPEEKKGSDADSELSEEEKTALDTIKNPEEKKESKFKKVVSNIKTAGSNLLSKMNTNKGKIVASVAGIAAVAGVALVALGPAGIAALSTGIAGAVAYNHINKGIKGR